MLDERAKYERTGPEGQTIKLGAPGAVSINGKIPERTKPKVAHIWIHPHDMGSEGYFWGGWLSVIIEKDTWTFSPSISRLQPFSPKKPVKRKSLKRK